MGIEVKTRTLCNGFLSGLSGLAVLLGWAWAPPAASRADQAGLGAAAVPDLVERCAGCKMRLDIPGPAALTPAHRQRVHEALGNGYGVQYWGRTYDVATLAAAPHGLLIIEATRIGADETPERQERSFSRQEIRQISRHGTRPVLAYLNLAEIEAYRDYWTPIRQAADGLKPSRDPGWIGPLTTQGERLARYWTPAWQAILEDRVDRIMSLGFDGIFLDDALHYYTFAMDKHLTLTGAGAPDGPQGAHAHAQAMMQLVIRLAAQSRRRNCDAIVLVNNGVFIGRDAGSSAAALAVFDQYRAAVDGILVETVFAAPSRQQTIDVLGQDFGSRGTAVLTLDFGTDFRGIEPSLLRGWLARRAADAGFVAYLAPDAAFDRLSDPLTAPQRVRPAQ